ncbi:hypothetical protein BFP70_02245 [Thioclava sp. SK-1]|uniref:YIP1 family protein n=1 Tax=Thioclava sp. SK-1 TaxID=1889770 RepID=UPI000825F748|nr:YIP1 family protein [Thioclava sp. SK-1]OCX67015.1 hypothetical protein BFP70_02245 [Thioclava sp. SK-1]
MQLGPFDLKEALIRSVKAPREMAAALIDYAPPAQARYLALLVVVVLSACLGSLADIVFSMVSGTGSDTLRASPIPLALIQGALLVYGAAAMTVVGRIANGKGQFLDALMLLSWMEFVLIVGQVVQLVLLMIFPVTALITSALLLALMFYLLVNFTAAVHGFTQLVPVAIGVIATFIGSAFLAGILLVSTGLVPISVAP